MKSIHGITRETIAQEGVLAVALKTQPGIVHEMDEEGNRLLHYAAAADAREAVQLLLDADADGMHYQNKTGQSPLNIAASNSPHAGRAMAMRWFHGACAGKGRSLNDTSGALLTPLIQYAAKWCSGEELTQMIAQGINLCVANGNGWTPLLAAAAIPGQVDAVRILIDAYRQAGRQDMLNARTTKPYTVTYSPTSGTEPCKVVYPAGLNAHDICRTRLTKDRSLSHAQKKQLQEIEQAIRERMADIIR